MQIKQQLIPTSQYATKCPYLMTPIGVCIHNTANRASAQDERNNVARLDNHSEVSFHIAVDDVEAIQLIPYNRNAWASGDGANGTGNRKYIHIEICYSLDGGTKFIQAEKNCAKVVAQLLKQNGWTIANVKKHQDFSNKYCPHRTLDMGWQRFLNMIIAEMKPTETPKPPQPTGEYLISEYAEKGVFTCTVDSIYFRNKPLVSSSNPTQGQYFKGESVNYDKVAITNKYVYISWVSASSGIRRYMPYWDKVADPKGLDRWGTIK